MKVTVYLKPGDNPEEISRIASSIIEQATGQTCDVRITGQGMAASKKNSLIEDITLPAYRGF